MSEEEEDEGVQEGRREDGDKAGDKVGLFIGPRQTWGPIFGFGCHKQTERRL